jgi:serine/threonine protein kinase
MNFGPTVVGQQNKWNLVKKLGEGDAGEVYLVESLVGGKKAVLKRPQKRPFYSDVLRQASQIQREANVLSALKGITFPFAGTHLYTPALLDQSLVEDGLGERLFIILEWAAGFDLQALFNLTHFGLVNEDRVFLGAENEFFIQKLSEFREIPEPILIRSLFSVISLLETIHSAEVRNEGVKQFGVVWNDVKPDHLYWDPEHACVTVIDWGNSYFLEADGTTLDRQHSSNDDYYQFVQAMGEFLAESHPDLYARLEWPQEITPGNAYTDGVKPLKERLLSCNEEVLSRVRDMREAIASLHGVSRPELDHLSQNEELQRQIVAFGELPDFASALNFHARVALKMASDANLVGFQQVCERTASLPIAPTDKWELLGEIAEIARLKNTSQDDKSRGSLANVLSAGVADDWPTLLWGMYDLIGNGPMPDWLEKVSQGIRRVYLKVDDAALTPYTAISRLYHTLRAVVMQMEDDHLSIPSKGEPISAEKLHAVGNLLKIFNEEVMKKWKETDPAPPNSGVGYDDIDRFAEQIEAVLPGTQEKLEKVLDQPKAQAAIFQDAWERKDFETACKALRFMLVWDPDRRRLIRADQAIGTASRWLANIRAGAGADEPFYDYLTSVELAGRNLRNCVGQAEWLDLLLDALKRLRKGIRPADLIMEHPEILSEIPWLNEHRSREILSLEHTRPLTLERDNSVSIQVRTVIGAEEGRLGEGEDFRLAEPLDTWIPEARGSSARVFAGSLRRQAGKPLSCAVKIMRPDQVEYALPLFIEEVQILSLLRDIPGVTPLVECGYLRLEEGQEFPADKGHASARHLKGPVVRFGIEDVQNFLASMDRQLAQGWLPYLALVKRDQEQNLMRYCDAGYTHGWFLPLRQSLLLAIQICDILQIAHDRNIVYRDHKILHYYWDPESRGVTMIDWNIAKRHSQGLSEAERQFDLVQFGARALHHILTGRPAPGALPLGPNRPEEIEHASLHYSVNWTYDDERLPNRAKEILEQALAQGYAQIRDLRLDLVQVYQQIPEAV